MITNHGHLSVDLPHDLLGGYYLVRPELLALHQADKTPSDPQFYVGCAQLFIHSSGAAIPAQEDTVQIPGYVAAGQPPVTFNIYAQPLALPYPMPGPAVSSLNCSSSTPSTQKQTIGLKPANCVLESANWCGIELAPYTDEKGCWNASASCWKQCSECYDEAPPTGSAGCRIWEGKCTAIQKGCGSGSFVGPPDMGRVLTPAKSRLSLLAV